jgi:diguanylate cyclase (GGDEF)-like protein
MERMAQELQRSYREKSTFAIILSDIDYFKKVNDNYGHQAGDEALKKFADQMKMLLRPYDLLARYGGEEFIFYTPGVGLVDAKSIAERLRESAEDMKINLPDIAQSIQITASFGVSMFAADADDDLDALIKRADEALYKAKNDGRNCVRLG